MNDTPATPAPDSPIPPAVDAILDDASVPGGPYSASFTANTVQLVVTATREVVREAHWEGAGQFSQNLLRNVLGASPMAAAPLPAFRADLQLPQP